MNSKHLLFAIAATLMLSQAACSRHKSKKDGGSPAAAQQTPKPAVDAQCPKNIEGLWKMRKVAEIVNFQTSVESFENFTIGRDSQSGILQMTKPNLVGQIVFDGQYRAIEFKDQQSRPTGEGAAYSAKCVNGMLYISEKTQNKLGEESVVNYEYELRGDLLDGMVKITSGSESERFGLIKSLPPAGMEL